MSNNLRAERMNFEAELTRLASNSNLKLEELEEKKVQRKVVEEQRKIAQASDLGKGIGARTLVEKKEFSTTPVLIGGAFLFAWLFGII